MKICIIGNSHIGAVKNGHERLSRSGFDLDIRFFGAPSTTLKHLRARDDVLFTNNDALRKHLQATADGAAELSLLPYDVLVVLGGQLHITSALQLFKQSRPARFFDGDGEMISESAFGAALDDVFERSTAAHVLRLVAPAGNRVIVMPAPMRSELVIGQDEYPFLSDSARRSAVIGWLSSMCRDSWLRLADRYHAELLEQPPDTLGESGLTRAEFSSLRTYRDKRWVDEPDTVHANAAYGEHVLRHLRWYLLGADSARPAAMA